MNVWLECVPIHGKDKDEFHRISEDLAQGWIKSQGILSPLCCILRALWIKGSTGRLLQFILMI